MSVKTYGPKQVQCIIGGNIISGFHDGTFITVERDVDAFTKHVGGDGEVARVRSANKSGMLTLTLQSTSASNDVLSALAQTDELNGDGVVPIILKDSSGRTTVFSGEGWVRKMANADFGEEITPREWVIDLAQMDYFVGGNT